jgi:hypothetical protein
VEVALFTAVNGIPELHHDIPEAREERCAATAGLVLRSVEV